MSSKRRFAAVLAATTVGLGVLSAGAGSVQAAAGDVLGPVKVNPKTGNQASLVEFSTLNGQKCAAGTGSIQILLTGGIMTAENPGVINGNTDYSQVQGASNNLFVSAGRTFGEVFGEVGITSPSGVYRVHLQCLDDNLQSTGEFGIDTTWTPTGGAGNGSYVAASTAQATTTSLTAGPEDPVVAGTSSTLTATVTPSDVAGAVQFKNGAANLGSPLPVVAGVAAFNGALPAGTNSLTAQFVPADADAFASSTSAVRSYAVAGPTSITGTARVGGTITCNASTGGTRTYLWKKNGVSTGVTAASVAVPASWLNASVSCDLTSTKAPTSVTRSSAAVKITVGVAPVAKVKPKVLGITKVGRRLTCSPGSWSPAASSYKYQWLRSGRPIAGKVAKTYRTVARDRGKLISCKVTALRTGHLSGVAKSPARKVT